MIDIARQLAAIHRAVGTRKLESDEVVSVVLRRTYDAAVDDVWEAVTDPVRVRRWFLPLSGDLRVGGTFQLEGNAGGEILACEPPRRLRVTFGGPVSLVEVRLTADGDRTTLDLEHTVPIEMAGSGAGALYVGPGWDAMLMALDLHFDAGAGIDPVTAGMSEEGLEFSRRSVGAWAAVVEASGTAEPDQITAAVEMSLAQFAPGPERQG